jgi:hypothetical protein
MFKIEAGIPLPPPARGGGRPTKYPFADMVVGQSFQVDIPEGKTPKQVAQMVSNSAQNWVTRTDAKISFSVRVIDAKTVRVWAVERRKT